MKKPPPFIELYTYRQLIKQLAIRDLKARYKVSVLGFFWSLLRPLLTIAVLALIFSMIMPDEGISYSVPYFVLLLTAYMPWFFFSGALLQGVYSIVGNANLIKKVYCPRPVFPASVVLSNLVNYMLSMIVIIPALYILSGATPSWALLQLPFVIAIHTAFLFGLCLYTSISNVLYRDTTQIVEFIVFVWFYVSPVLYDVFMIAKELGSTTKFIIYFLNPMAGIIEWYRYSLLASEIKIMDGDQAAYQQIIFTFGIPYAIVVSLLVFAVGYLLHKRLETKAVDAL
jgi:lipopolysaccharide transport system permease protein